jgi:predicted MFS family arabinose efflux permease
MASSGGAVGLIVNAGVLRVLPTASAWRVGFWVAAAVSLAVAALMVRVPAPDGGHDSASVDGRSPITVVVVILAACAAVATSPFVAFVVAMVIEELGRSATLGAAVVVVAGLAGIVSAPVMGRVIDRSGPVPALRIGAAAFGVSVACAAAFPGPFSLAVAAVGFGFLNYPVWAVIGAAAGTVLPPAGVTRLMSWALVSFGVSASVAVPLTGVVFEATGTLRPALVVFAFTGVAMAALAGRLNES